MQFRKVYFALLKTIVTIIVHLNLSFYLQKPDACVV